MFHGYHRFKHREFQQRWSDWRWISHPESLQKAQVNNAVNPHEVIHKYLKQRKQKTNVRKKNMWIMRLFVKKKWSSLISPFFVGKSEATHHGSPPFSQPLCCTALYKAGFPEVFPSDVWISTCFDCKQFSWLLLSLFLLLSLLVLLLCIYIYINLST